MKQSKGFLQTVSVWSGVASFVISAICGVLLYFKVKETGFENPVSASLLASVFFFIFMGILLSIIGRSNLPSFKFDDPEDK
jgi:tetrahydromethanopterin S-methyltransferase subunit D